MANEQSNMEPGTRALSNILDNYRLVSNWSLVSIQDYDGQNIGQSSSDECSSIFDCVLATTAEDAYYVTCPLHRSKLENGN